MRFRRAGLILGFLVLGCGIAHARDEINCRSEDYRYTYCRADTDNRVELLRRSSSSACDVGRSWGYDRRGIWVDNGCAATFRYGGGGRGGSDAGKVVAGVAAIAILGAIISANNGRKDDRNRDRDGWNSGRVPGWAVGRFHGNDRDSGARVDITVNGNGRIGGYSGREDIDGEIDGDRAYLGSRSYAIASRAAGSD